MSNRFHQDPEQQRRMAGAHRSASDAVSERAESDFIREEFLDPRKFPQYLGIGGWVLLDRNVRHNNARRAGLTSVADDHWGVGDVADGASVAFESADGMGGDLVRRVMPEV